MVSGRRARRLKRRGASWRMNNERKREHVNFRLSEHMEPWEPILEASHSVQRSFWLTWPASTTSSSTRALPPSTICSSSLSFLRTPRRDERTLMRGPSVATAFENESAEERRISETKAARGGEKREGEAHSVERLQCLFKRLFLEVIDSFLVGSQSGECREHGSEERRTRREEGRQVRSTLEEGKLSSSKSIEGARQLLPSLVKFSFGRCFSPLRIISATSSSISILTTRSFDLEISQQQVLEVSLVELDLSFLLPSNPYVRAIYSTKTSSTSQR